MKEGLQQRAVNPGTVRIAVCGAGSERIQTLLNRYQKIPILKISITLTANDLICKVPQPIRRRFSKRLAGGNTAVLHRFAADVTEFLD